MKIGHYILIILAACIASYFYYCLKPVWDYDHLEKRAHKVITATELQAWATNLLGHYPDDTNLSVSQLGTDFPPQLSRLAPRLWPRVYIRRFDTNRPPFVQIAWGSGFLGGTGFYVGSTNFTLGDDPRNLTNDTYIRLPSGYLRLWQPGVWFYEGH